jgi:branched-chain amino acid transport system permease protein
MALDAAAARAGQALRDAGLHGDWSRSASELSYADQKLLSLARVEAAGPKVIMLDEPASGLDADSLRSVAEVVRELAARGRAVCVIEHNTKLIQEVADDMVFMYAGQVRAQGRPDEIIADPALAELYFGKPRAADRDSTTVEAVIPGKTGTP